MPLINVHISQTEIADSKTLLKQLSSEISSLTGKPEQYVMCLLQTGVPMSFAGSNDPCCYIEVKSIGALQPPKMSESLCKLIHENTGIPSDRIYIGFEDVPANKWGYNGQTFG